jgi:predicted transposase YbfD/YdcC
VAVTQQFVIFSHFEDLTDPRIERTKRHRLSDMVAIALCATICGADSWADVERFGNAKLDWFETFLHLEHGIPSHDTFGRVFASLDTEEFLACLTSWVASLRLSLQGQTVAIDGKTLRRSFDAASGKTALHLVSAWAGELRLSLGQVAVDQKSNEIPAVIKLLELLDLDGAVVTLDAMHCQKETAAAIRRRGADYLLSVKANQPKLLEQLQDLFEAYGDEAWQGTRRMTQADPARHGRSELREYIVAPSPQGLDAAWCDIRSVGMVYRHREASGKSSDEVSYFISSLPPKVRTLSKHVRGHWGVENGLHWTLDVTFSEDKSRIRKAAGPEIAAVFRRLALSILKQDTTLKENIHGKRVRAGWNNDTLQAILTRNAA